MKKLNCLLAILPMVVTAQEIQLDQVNVEGRRNQSNFTVIKNNKSSTITSDSAKQIEEVPGALTITNGGFASLPVIHGMNDDRNKTNIDSMQVTSACPNYMNTALSYVDSSKLSSLEVYTGLVPVSIGGDSIGGVVTAKTINGEYAEEGKNISAKSEIGTLYKSVNKAKAFHGNIGLSTQNQSLQYAGSTEKAENYKDGNGEKVKATLYKQTSHLITFANRIDDGEIGVKLGQQHVPYEGFPTQYMDMLYNKSEFANVFARKKIGEVETNFDVYLKSTDHYMNTILSERSGDMPMYTWSQEWGYKFHANFPIGTNHKLKVGHELYQFMLNDWWPPITNNVSMMGPDTFKNINHGSRNRIAFFADSDSEWTSKWTSNIGVRAELVKMNAREVTGYNNDVGSMNSNAPLDAAAFNAKDRKKDDTNIDLTSKANFKATENLDVDFGYARKTRSPNLYERYTWAGATTSPATDVMMGGGSIMMDMMMINWFGDGNGYVGNVNLKPEVAHVISSKVDLHSTDVKGWQVKLNPHLNAVENYIDADLLHTDSNIAYLQFANHNALLWGADLQVKSQELEVGKFGTINSILSASYLNGKRTDGVDRLYNIAPLNGKFTILHQLNSWNNQLELVGFARKSVVSSRRLEIVTPGYAILNLRTQYKFITNTSIDFAIENVFDKQYQPALGGRNVLDGLKAMRGAGRSFNVALTQNF